MIDTDREVTGACQQCGMVCVPMEYHPHAACMMFMYCHDGESVRANLSAVRQQARLDAVAGYRNELSARLQLDLMHRKTYARVEIISALDEIDIVLDRLREEGEG